MVFGDNISLQLMGDATEPRVKLNFRFEIIYTGIINDKLKPESQMEDQN